jgi:hypothetical protein
MLPARKGLQLRLLRYELLRYIDGGQEIQTLQTDDRGIPDLIRIDLNLRRRDNFDF